MTIFVNLFIKSVIKKMTIVTLTKTLNIVFSVVPKGHFTHETLRAHDHCTSSTLIGGKGGVDPFSFATMLEGPT